MKPILALAGAALLLALPPGGQATARAAEPLLRSVHVTVGKPTFSPRRTVRRTARAFYGVLVFGRPPKAGSRVRFRFFGPDGSLVASRDFRALSTDEGLYVRVPRSFFRDRPGRWRLTVAVGRLAKTWRFRVT